MVAMGGGNAILDAWDFRTRRQIVNQWQRQEPTATRVFSLIVRITPEAASFFSGRQLA